MYIFYFLWFTAILISFDHNYCDTLKVICSEKK